MAASKTYDIGDTVFVAYPFPSSNGFTPQSRVVSDINFSGTGNDAEVKFDDGVPVQDTDAAPTVYTTEAACATAIVDDVIAKSAAAVVLDATTSEESVAAQPSTTLGRVD